MRQEKPQAALDRGGIQRRYRATHIGKPDHVLLREYLSHEWKISKALVIKILTQLSEMLSTC